MAQDIWLWWSCGVARPGQDCTLCPWLNTHWIASPWHQCSTKCLPISPSPLHPPCYCCLTLLIILWAKRGMCPHGPTVMLAPLQSSRQTCIVRVVLRELDCARNGVLLLHVWYKQDRYLSYNEWGYFDWNEECYVNWVTCCVTQHAGAANTEAIPASVQYESCLWLSPQVVTVSKKCCCMSWQGCEFLFSHVIIIALCTYGPEALC